MSLTICLTFSLLCKSHHIIRQHFNKYKSTVLLPHGQTLWCNTTPNWRILSVPSTNHRKALLPSRRERKQKVIMLATCWKDTWYGHVIRTFSVLAPTCQSHWHTEVSLWWKAHPLCPSTALLVSFLASYFEYVFNDIQISTHILP